MLLIDFLKGKAVLLAKVPVMLRNIADPFSDFDAVNKRTLDAAVDALREEFTPGGISGSGSGGEIAFEISGVGGVGGGWDFISVEETSPGSGLFNVKGTIQGLNVVGAALTSQFQWSGEFTVEVSGSGYLLRQRQEVLMNFGIDVSDFSCYFESAQDPLISGFGMITTTATGSFDA